MLTPREREARELLIGARVRELQARFHGYETPQGIKYLQVAERLRVEAAELGYRSL